MVEVKTVKELRKKRTKYMRIYNRKFSDNAKACGGHGHGKKIILELALVEQLYVSEQLSVGSVALKLGVGRTTVTRNLQRWGIPIRPAGTQNHIDLSLGRRIISWRGEGSPNWKGGRGTKDGYVYITNPDRFNPGRSARIPEHVLVWEQANNRPIPKGWHVHHKNGIRNDNRPCNLLALDPSSHASTTQKMLDSLKRRIRELEAENRLLQKSLDDSQMIFHISEN